MTGRLAQDVSTLLRIGVPVIGVNITQTAMQLTDAYMVGTLGPEPLAALTPPGLLLFVLHSAGYGLLSATTAMVAQAFGGGRPRDCGMYGWQGLYVALAAGAASLLLWPVAARVLSVFPHEGASLLSQETTYLRIGLIGVAPAMAAMALANVFLGVQRTLVVMLASAAALWVNVVVNYALIFGHWGLPALGLAGAAWGTVSGAAVHALILLAVFLSPWFAQAFGGWRWPARWPIQRAMIRVGGPAGLQTALEVAAWGLVMTWLIAFFGTVHLAAATVLVRCMQLTFLPAEGIALATQTMVGGAVGAGDPARARSYAWLGFCVVAPYMIGLGAAMYIWREPLLRAFTSDPEVIAIGVASMRFVAALQAFDAMAVIYVHVLQGVGDNRWPLMATLILTLGVLVLGGAAVVVFAPHVGSVGIWAVGFVYTALLGLAFLYRWHAEQWTEIRLLPASHPTGPKPSAGLPRSL